MVLEETVPFINTYKQYIEHIERLPLDVQLRCISKNSYKGDFADICFVYDVQKDNLLLVPYYVGKAHLPSKTEKIKNVEENVQTLAIRIVQSISGLQVTGEPVVLGSPLHKLDKDGNIMFDSIPKYPVLITEFSGMLNKDNESIFDKIGSPVWVSREFAKNIFTKGRISEEGKTIEHPHREAYKRFEEYRIMAIELKKIQK